MSGGYNQAITLGIKKEYRKKVGQEELVVKIYKLMNQYKSRYFVFSIEDYATTGLHVHIYFEGPEPMWMDFNKSWGLGYIKNKPVYDIAGWIRYIKKKGIYWEMGKMEKRKKITPIERLTGISLESLEDEEEDVDTISLPFESDDDNLPF